MKRTINKQKHKKIRPIIYLSLTATIAASTVFGLLMLLQRQPDNLATTDRSINYDPPTEEEIKTGQNIKSENEKKTDQPTVADYSISIASAAIYDANAEVHADVNGINKDGGTCTFTFKKDNSSVTKTSEGIFNTTRTSCAIAVPTSDFPSSGTWSVAINYLSDTISIDSPTQNMEITK